MSLSLRAVRYGIKPLWFLTGLWPLMWLVMAAFAINGQTLRANPVETIQDLTGITALRILLVTLTLTPLRQITGAVWLIQLRRMTGLFAFFYAALHFTNYLWLDQGFSLSEIAEDVIKRTFITVGFAALLLLIALAATSTSNLRRRMGRRWNRLHRWIYPAAILVCWHFWWQVKKDFTEPLIYCLILAVLLGYRLWQYQLRRSAQAAKIL